MISAVTQNKSSNSIRILELKDLQSKFTLKCKKYYIKKQKYTIFFHKPPLTYSKNVKETYKPEKNLQKVSNLEF